VPVANVSIIIVARNGKKITLECLKSLKTEKVKEIIFVDNASSDDTVKAVKTFATRNTLPLQIIQNSKNNGFAEANNQGAKIATGKYILFLNNDTLVTPKFLQPLITVLEKDKKAAAVQPLILFPNGTIDSVGSYLTSTGFLYHRAHRQLPSPLSLTPAKVYSLKGACMLWKKSVLNKIGLLDESYFAYFEETELCHRAINLGYSVHFTPKSKIIHYGGFTSNTMNQAFVQYHNAKNRIATYIKHLPLNEVIKILPLHLALCEALVLKTILRSPTDAWAIQKGLVVGIVKGIQKRNEFSQKIKSRKDLSAVTKSPDTSYYRALFSSLEGYNKIW
jgi:GT2 family glycosyltransferase